MFPSPDHSLVGMALLKSQLSSSDPDFDPLNELFIDLCYVNINLLEAVSYSPGEAFTSINPLGTPGKSLV